MSNESIEALLGRFGYASLEDLKSDLAKLEANGEVDNLNALVSRFGYDSLETLKSDINNVKTQAQETSLNGLGYKFGYNQPNYLVSDIEHVKTGTYTEIASPVSTKPANPILSNDSVATLNKLKSGVTKGSKHTLSFSVADGSSIIVTGGSRSNVHAEVNGTDVTLTVNNPAIISIKTVKNGYTCFTPYTIPVMVSGSSGQAALKDAWQINVAYEGVLFRVGKYTALTKYTDRINKIKLVKNGALELVTLDSVVTDGTILSNNGTVVNINPNVVGEGYVELTVPEDETHRTTTVRYPVLVGQSDSGSGTKNPNVSVSKVTPKLTASSPVGEIVCSATAAGYVYSLDPHIADVTNATSNGGSPTGTVSITGYRNGIARFGIRAVSSQYLRSETMITVECSGFKESAEQYPALAGKWLVVPVIGQSNAVGYDESLWDPKDYPRTSRIAQLGYYKNNLKVDYLTAVADNFQDMRVVNRTNLIPCEGTRGIHYDLAKALLDIIPSSYGIMFVPCAYGGSGFTTGNEGTYDAATMKPSGSTKWTTTSALMQATIARIRKAVEMNPSNRLLCAIYCMGENDGQANVAKDVYTTKFQEFVSHLNSNLADLKMFNGTKFSFATSVIGYKACKYWESVGTYATSVLPVQREVFGDRFVEVNDDLTTDSNATNGTGKTSSTKECHYGNDAYRRLVVPALFSKIKSVFGNKITVK